MTAIVLAVIVALFGASLAVGVIRLGALDVTRGYIVLGALLATSALSQLARRNGALAAYAAAGA